MQMRDEIALRDRRRAESASRRPTTTQAGARLWGMQRTLVQNLVTGVTEGFTKVLEITGVGYRAAGPGQEPAAAARLQPRRQLPGPRRRRGQDSRPEHGRDQRHRQAEGRPGRGRDPPLAQARAVQGQGHQVSRRVYLPQRRQEEVSHGQTLPLRPPPPPRAHRASRRVPRASRGFRSTARAGTSTRRSSTMPRARRSPRPRPWTRTSRARPARPSDGAAAVGKTLAERAKKAGVSRSCSIVAASCSMAG